MTARLEWDDREQLGTLRGFARTWWRLISKPSEALEAAEDDGRLRDAVLYALLSYALGAIPSLTFFFFNTLRPAFRGASPDAMTAPLVAPAMLLVYAAGLLGLLVVQLFVLSFFEWALLKLTGAREATWPRAVRAHAFGTSAFVVALIPAVGVLLATVWTIALRVMAVRRFQQVGTGRAAFSVVSPVLLFCGVGVVGVVLLLGVLGPAVWDVVKTWHVP